jgi:hypothetical protein
MRAPQGKALRKKGFHFYRPVFGILVDDAQILLDAAVGSVGAASPAETRQALSSRFIVTRSSSRSR